LILVCGGSSFFSGAETVLQAGPENKAKRNIIITKQDLVCIIFEIPPDIL